jgi:hypothetical protein
VGQHRQELVLVPIRILQRDFILLAWRIVERDADEPDGFARVVVNEVAIRRQSESLSVVGADNAMFLGEERMLALGLFDRSPDSFTILGMNAVVPHLHGCLPARRRRQTEHAEATLGPDRVSGARIDVPSSSIEAGRRCELLETEMRRRKQKIPTRPDPKAAFQKREERISELDGVELMQRYFKSKRILEEEVERTGIWKQTKIEYDLLRAEIDRRSINLPPTGYDDPAFPFTKQTSIRLRELLDRTQYEMTKCDPESVTYPEAARDIGFIGAELRRREKERSSAKDSRASG